MDEVSLLVDGNRYSGWTSVRIGNSLNQFAKTFQVDLTEQWTGQSIRPIKPGAAVSVLVGDRVELTGYIDEVAPKYNAKSHSLQVVGRSRGADIVDCSHKGKSFKQQTLVQVAEQLLKPFELSVSADVDIGGAFAEVAIDEGQIIFDFLQELARIRGVLIQSDDKGNVVFTTAGKGGESAALELGNNIRSASGRFSYRDRFSEITVYAQQKAGGLFAPSDTALNGKTVPDDVDRYRPLVVVSSTPVGIGGCESAAKWERGKRYGKSQSIVYTVSGWDGWDLNTLCHVEDSFLEIKEQRLVAGTQKVLDSGGRRMEIEVVPKEAFTLQKLPEPKSEGGLFG